MSLYGSMGVTVEGRGKTMAWGVVTPTSAAHEVDTGLSVVDRVLVSDAADVTLTHMFTSGKPSSTAGYVTIESQKPTSNSNLTLLNSTTPWHAVAWVAFGDR